MIPSFPAVAVLALTVALSNTCPQMLAGKMPASNVQARIPAIELQRVRNPPRQATGRAIAAVANMPPNPIVSTAEEGTITIEPFSLIAS